MSNLESIVAEIQRVNLHGDLWVDGSFLTKKINPGDVDFVLHVTEGQGFSQQKNEHVRVMKWIGSNLKASHKCDSFHNIIPPVVHMTYTIAIARKAYWEKQFGYSRGNIAKGIAVIHV